MDSLSQFITDYTGEAASYDGLAENQGQCEQLVCVYWQKVFGYNAPIVPLAVELWTNPVILESFEQIPVGQEQSGDVAVFGASSSINSPTAGHTDIVVGSVTSSGYQGFDSNWQPLNLNAAGYPTAHLTSHTNNDVLGFLRYKGAEMNSGQVQNLYDAVLMRAPTAAEIANWTGKVFSDLFNVLYDSQECQNLHANHTVNNGDIVNMKNKGIDISASGGADWKSALYANTTKVTTPNATQLKPGLYEV